MKLGKAGWLAAMLSGVAARHVAGAAAAGLPPNLRSGKARARAHLRRTLRASGLLYGTPASTTQAQPGAAREEVLFLAVMETFARVAMDLAALAGAPPGPRAEQLLLLFAALTGLLDEAEEIADELAAPGGRVARRRWARVESALEYRAMSLAGDPAYGLVLHNGAVYADAQLFGHHALELFTRGRLRRSAVERRIQASARQKALLVEVLTALACAEKRPSFPARRAIIRQIEDLQLPSAVESELRARVRRYFERPPRLSSVRAAHRTRDVRRFLLEQALLASLVDGRREPAELAFLNDLANALRFSPEELSRLEVEMAEFYAQNRSVVDVFTVSAGAGLLSDELVESMQSAVEKNFNRLMKEVKETGELSVLLAKAARGQKLTSDERGKMRNQLIDVAKAIPALAIFAAPGGLLLLIALAKVLPFNLMPSAFTEDETSNVGRDPRRS